MLKNKKVVYLLIPLNVAIWGFFIYRIYSAYTDSDVTMEAQNIQALKISTLEDSAMYVLSLDYKDPFLKGGEHTVKNYAGNGPPAEPLKKQAAPVKAAPVPKPLPDVKYFGLIKNSNSGSITALVSVNGQSKLIKPNETMDGITFKSFNNDSLVARWGKEKIVVRK
jgi:hypothetical protein